MERTFSEYLKEGKASFDSPEDMATQIEKMIKGYFPKSFARVKASTGLGHSIGITFAIGTANEWSNKIIHNDPVHTSIIIHIRNEPVDFMGEKMQVDSSTSGITIAPPEGSFYAYGTVKNTLRKKTATPDAVFKHLDNYFKKTKQLVKDNLGKMTPEHKKIAEKKV